MSNHLYRLRVKEHCSKQGAVKPDDDFYVCQNEVFESQAKYLIVNKKMTGIGTLKEKFR